MPLLEPRGKTYQTDSLMRGCISFCINTFQLILKIFQFSVGQYWAIVWAITHLGGFVVGSYMPLYWGPGNVVVYSRLACLVPVFLGILHRHWTVVVWMAVFILSFCAGSLEYHNRNERISVRAPSPWAPSYEESYAGTGIFIPTAWAKAGRDSFWQTPAILVAWKPISKENGLVSHPQSGSTLMVSGKGLLPLPGEVIGASLDIKVPQSSSLPGIFDGRKYLKGRGINWRARCSNSMMISHSQGYISRFYGIMSEFRDKVLLAIDEGIPAPESHLMMAVLLGARSPEAREAAQPFSRLGLSHLFAVSGLHVGILVGIILLPLVLFNSGAGWRIIPVILFLPFYILLTGAPGSVIRASGMSILLLLAIPLGRQAHSLQLLGILFWCGIIWEPIQVLDPGLRLSFLATGGIIVIAGMISSAKNPFWQSKKGKVAMGLVVSLSAQWFTFPQIASSFGFLSGFSPLANLFMVPLFGVAVWALVLGLPGEFLLPGLGQSLLSWTWIIVRFLTGVLDKISPAVQSWNMTFPVPDLIDGLAWILGTLIILGSVRSWSCGKLTSSKTIIALVFVFLAVLYQFQRGALGNDSTKDIHVWQFDVGQGDCSMIIFPDRWCGMIDTAGVTGWGRGDGSEVFARKVQPWLGRQKIETINSIVLSHGHLDHTAGTNFLLSNYFVGTVYTGGCSEQSISTFENMPQIKYPHMGEVLHHWEDWVLYFSQPDTLQTNHLHENDQSLVVVLKKGDAVQMVWTGDMEEKEEAILLKSTWMPDNTVVLKAGHHGSNTSSSQPFLTKLTPELVLISCGVGNRYHHPSHGPYFAAGDTIKTLRTDLSGCIHLWWGKMGDFHYETRNSNSFMRNP